MFQLSFIPYVIIILYVILPKYYFNNHLLLHIQVSIPHLVMGVEQRAPCGGSISFGHHSDGLFLHWEFDQVNWEAKHQEANFSSQKYCRPSYPLEYHLLTLNVF